ncbi:MAG: YlbF family regulator [Lachnospiraceae bacterium]|nr:YlbF family regulator [Lachnospiraceae bacterium]MBQ4069074.1 YlbF family regulator [Lachnospiraceae bacterium]
MYEIKARARDLSSSILRSKEYRSYIENYEEIKNDEFLMVRLNGLRKKRFGLQYNDGSNMKQHMDELYNEFRDVYENDKARRFLDSEMALCRMLQKVNRAVLTDLEMNLDFL